MESSLCQVFYALISNRIIECAIEAEAHYIITGDNHLLRLEQIEGIKIVNPDKMLEILKANEE
jgi:predicted nucleic acid-binding protein